MSELQRSSRDEGARSSVKINIDMEAERLSEMAKNFDFNIFTQVS